MQKILTVPRPMEEKDAFCVAGNHYVSLSEVNPDGTVAAISHLRESLNALVEIRGVPLFALLLNGAPLPVQFQGYQQPLMPSFSGHAPGLFIQQMVFAPEGRRGFVFRVTLTASQATHGTLALRAQPTAFSRAVFHTLPLEGHCALGTEDWAKTAYAEFRSGGGLTAIAIAGGQGTVQAQADAIQAVQPFSLEPGQSEILWFFVGVGAELDGARLANMDLRRRGATLYDAQRAFLQARHFSIPTDPALEKMANLNLMFCYAFSLGRALDTGALLLTTSRSSRYYVSGAYWARDCMLWAFPAWLRVDRLLAREALLLACTRYLERGADHALYLNGMSLYPGFEMDQLVAPILALKRYLQITGEETFLDLPEIRHALSFTLAALASWRDPATGLYRTELSPSDDPEELPFLTYDNALVLAALRFMQEKGLDASGDISADISALEKGLRRHCVVTHQGKPMLAWSTDGQGRHLLYDNPPGSLALLPYYGAMDASDPVYVATVEHYFSPDNPWYTENETLCGQGCEHAPMPWPMSLCNLLLARGRDEKILGSLRAMAMDNGIACETVDPGGQLCTGAAFATAAGFLANAIFEAYGL